MEYEEVIRVFALRTKKNLKYIESWANEDNYKPAGTEERFFCATVMEL